MKKQKISKKALRIISVLFLALSLFAGSIAASASVLPDADQSESISLEKKVETETEEDEDKEISGEASDEEESDTIGEGAGNTFDEISDETVGNFSEEWLSKDTADIDAMFGAESSPVSLLSSGHVSGYISGYFYGGATASINVDGKLAFCLLPWSSIPDINANFADYYINGSSNANHQLMGKIMYYGYGGGGNILGAYSKFDQEAITHFALAYVWMMNLGNSYGLPNPWKTGSSQVNETGQQIVLNFINTVSSKPSVKGTLHISSLYTASGNTFQDVAYGYFEPEIQKGKAQILKSSSDSQITGLNNCYSLAGAVFGVYTNQNCQDNSKVGQLTTAENGYSNTIELNTGTYYIKEISAPKGFALDPQVHKAVVNANSTTIVYISDQPNTDPIGILLTKLDEETGKGIPQGNGSLANAEYTVRYFDNQTGEGTPKATWVFKTDNDGYISYSEDYKVSGSELYKINGIPVIPIGTIIIQETKAPEGYLLNSDKYVVHFTLQPDGTVRSDKGSWVTANKCENLDVCSEERTIRGGVEFKKADKDTNGNAKYDLSFEGTKIEIINESENEVLVNGAAYKKGEVVMTLTAGSDGIAKTSDNALPYGRYSARESEAPWGYKLNKNWNPEFVIKDNGVIVKNDIDGKDLILKDEIDTRKITVKKKVTGNMGNKNSKFDITLKLSGKGVPDELEYIKSDGTAGSLKVVNGEVKFKLSNDEYVTFTNITYGLSYQITEDESGSIGYVVDYSDNANGTLTDDEEILITNEKTYIVPTSADTNINVLALTGIICAAMIIFITLKIKNRKEV